MLLFGLWLTHRRITVAEKNVEAVQDGQITERFSRAVEQLSSENLTERLGEAATPGLAFGNA